MKSAIVLLAELSALASAAAVADKAVVQRAITTDWAALTVSATTTTISSTTLSATGTDENAILVEETGVAYLVAVDVEKTGDSSSSDESSTSVLNAAVGIRSEGTIYMEGGTITTDGVSANALHTEDDGASAYLYTVTIDASGEGAHGIYTAGGYIYASDLTVTTNDGKGSAIATDTGGGTILVETAEVKTYGSKSALLYSTGNITVSDMTGTSASAPAGCIDGSNSITITDSTISAAPDEHGVFQIVSTASSSSTSETAYIYIDSSSVSETAGTYGLLFVGNVIANIYLTDVTTSIDSGILLNSSADSDWGTSGSNGGNAYVYLSDLTIDGDVYVDDISIAVITLEDDTTWTGAANTDDTSGTVEIVIASGSTWVLTADSYITSLNNSGTVTTDGYVAYDEDGNVLAS